MIKTGYFLFLHSYFLVQKYKACPNHMGQADLRYHPNCRIKDTTAQFPLTQDDAALSRGGSGVAAPFSRGVSHRPTLL